MAVMSCLTEELVMALQLQDLDLLISEAEDQTSDPTDAVLSMQLYRDELRRTEQLLADRRMCASISTAVASDGPAVTAFQAEERRTEQDRRLALDMAGVRPGGREPGRPSAAWADEEQNMRDVIRRFGALNHLGASEQDQAEESVPRTDDREACEACNEDFPAARLMYGPCRHGYCHACIEHLFEAAMVEESLFPPRCCRQLIPMDAVADILSEQQLSRFRSRAAELATPNRTYCAMPLCSTFIPAERVIEERGRCPRCRHETCTTCKQLAHAGECPNDSALQNLLQAAHDAGWQRCYGCRRMVELDHGCNHIRCVCGVEFCYLCGLRWKTCSCDQWDEDRLLARAERVVQRREGDGGEGAGQARHMERVQVMQQNLRQNHECPHDQWQYLAGRHQCEECFHTLPQYIFECRQCRIMACNRCRRHRL